jgi:hypothetical protein
MSPRAVLSRPVFDPDEQRTYADRVRRRQPADNTFGQLDFFYR